MIGKIGNKKKLRTTGEARKIARFAHSDNETHGSG